MTGEVGRVVVGEQDVGAAFALGPRTVVTAHHIVHDAGDASITYVPNDAAAIEVVAVEAAPEVDAALLRLARDTPTLQPAPAVVDDRWRSVAPPPGERHLSGRIDAVDVTVLRRDRQVQVVQLTVDQHLGSYRGYSGNAVLTGHENTVVALLVEQTYERVGALDQPSRATNVLFAIPVERVASALSVPISLRTPEPVARQSEDLAELVTGWTEWVDEQVRRVDHLDDYERYYAVFVRNDGPRPATDVVVTCYTSQEGHRDLEVTWAAPALPGQRTWYILRETDAFPPDDDPPEVDIEFTTLGHRWRRHNNGPPEPA